MSFVLQAPNELIQTTSLLPEPSFGDGQGLDSELTLKRAMDGTLYSTIKTNNNRKLSYDFILTRGKTLEVIEFILTYSQYTVRLTNHKDEVWVGYITNNPAELSAIAIEEENQFRLEFQGRKISG